MKLEDQVTCKELSEKLEKLGVKQESLYWWRIYIPTKEATLTSDDYCKSNPKDYEHISAFTVAELGEALQDYSGNVEYDGGHKKWRIIYLDKKIELTDTEANARAKMLIYLIENNMNKPKQSQKG